MKKIPRYYELADSKAQPSYIINDEDARKVLDDNMKRGGPGDKTKPGEYDTSSWFVKMSESGQEILDDPESITSKTKNKDMWV